MHVGDMKNAAPGHPQLTQQAADLLKYVYVSTSLSKLPLISFLVNFPFVKPYLPTLDWPMKPLLLGAQGGGHSHCMQCLGIAAGSEVGRVGVTKQAET